MVSQSTSAREDKIALAQLIKDYFAAKELIDKLEAKLIVIETESNVALLHVEAMRTTIDKLKEDNEVLREAIIASEKTNGKQVAEFQSALEAERKRGNKKLLIGGGIGFIIGVILFAVAK